MRVMEDPQEFVQRLRELAIQKIGLEKVLELEKKTEEAIELAKPKPICDCCHCRIYG